MVQRVRRARVSVGEEVVGEVGPGLCVLLSVGPDDDDAVAAHLAGRVATLRIFADAAGRMNLDAGEAGGEMLVVSQFTLHADTSRGHRPSFIRAADPATAERLYEAFAAALAGRGLRVATGRFGATMQVEIINEGPVTLVLSSAEPPWQADAG